MLAAVVLPPQCETLFSRVHQKEKFLTKILGTKHLRKKWLGY